MSKTATYLPVNPLQFGMRAPITTQRMKALNQMATWLKQEKQTNYVCLYAGRENLSTTVGGLNYTVASTGSTWKELARFNLYVDADDTGHMQWAIAVEQTTTGDGLGEFGQFRLITPGATVLSTVNITADGWTSYAALSNVSSGWFEFVLQGRNNTGTAPGGGDSHYASYCYALSINAARVTSSHPDIP